MWTESAIKEMLQTNDDAVKRGLIAIFKRQTEDEREGDTTKHSNGIGFNAFDAKFASSLARQAQANGYFSAKQLAAGRKITLKYAKQLTKIANKAA